MWANFHTHCNFCDGKGAPEDYAAAAREAKLVSMGFSSHAPLPFARPWCMKPGTFDQYVSDIRRIAAASKDLEVYAGLEADYIPGRISPKEFSKHLDYTIGSVHFVETLPDGTPWEVDSTLAVFDEGYRSIFHGNIRETLWRYGDLIIEMVETACPSVVGHLDKIKIHNTGNRYFSESDPWYRELIGKVVTAISKSGPIVEINTRGIYQNKTSETYPAPWIIAALLEKGVPVTISSDAHHPADLTNRFAETAAMLHSIGYRRISVLTDGQWQSLPFDEKGIKR